MATDDTREAKAAEAQFAKQLAERTAPPTQPDLASYRRRQLGRVETQQAVHERTQRRSGE